MDKYYVTVYFPSGYSYKVEVNPFEITTLKINIETEHGTLKKVHIPISFDGSNYGSSCLNIKIKGDE